jgi:hypothetical protein
MPIGMNSSDTWIPPYPTCKCGCHCDAMADRREHAHQGHGWESFKATQRVLAYAGVTTWSTIEAVSCCAVCAYRHCPALLNTTIWSDDPPKLPNPLYFPPPAEAVTDVDDQADGN